MTDHIRNAKLVKRYNAELQSLFDAVDALRARAAITDQIADQKEQLALVAQKLSAVRATVDEV